MVDLEYGWGGWHWAFLGDIDDFTSRLGTSRLRGLFTCWPRAGDIHHLFALRAKAFVPHDGTIGRGHMVEIWVDFRRLGLSEVQHPDFALEIIGVDGLGQLVLHFPPVDDSVGTIWHGFVPPRCGCFG